MMDAILHAVTSAILGQDFGYGTTACRIMPDGHPAPECGEVFVAVHPGPVRGTMQNAKNDYYDFFVTLTMRVSDVPVDRIGDQRLAKVLARDRGFNRRLEDVASLLHMDWGVLQDANQYLVDNHPDAPLVYGFCEPWICAGIEVPVLVGGEWFWADERARDVGLKSEIRFAQARRLQAIATYTS